MIQKHAKKGGIVTGTIFGIGGLIIGVIVILVIVSTLNNASLLTSGSSEQGAVGNMTANFTSGLNQVSAKLPTILLIVAVVFLFGALVLLVRQAGLMGIGGGNSGGSL
jgi:hypothetical protein